MPGKKVDLSLTKHEEDYLKAIFYLEKEDHLVSTTDLAKALNMKPASVTEMIKRLSSKELIFYQPYQGVRLTEKGKHTAIYLVRKHRLWETFLVKTLNFSWSEVHEIAEQLEHVKNPMLIERLDEFLGFPEIDPHGEPIPDKEGNFPDLKVLPLSKASEKHFYKIIRILEPSQDFQEYLSSISLSLNDIVFLEKRYEYDESVLLKKGEEKILISKKAARNLLVQEVSK